jgi:hypothetical protein
MEELSNRLVEELRNNIVVGDEKFLEHNFFGNNINENKHNYGNKTIG